MQYTQDYDETLPVAVHGDMWNRRTSAGPT
jgi:hypothetical protein